MKAFLLLVKPSSIMLACAASVPVPRERNWGRVKEFIRIRTARKMRREQKNGRRGVGEGKGGNACPQTPRFWKTFSRLSSSIDWQRVGGKHGAGVPGCGVLGYGVPGSGKHGVWWKTRGPVENAGSNVENTGNHYFSPKYALSSLKW